jgi:hypothetical protein
MIDNICLKLPRKDNEGILQHISDTWHKDTHTYSGHIQNMGVYLSLDSIIIHGSLAKYLNGENVSMLTREQVGESIEKLELETGLSLAKAIVKSVECGIICTTNEPPSEYIKLFGYPPRFTRHEYATIQGVETITYSTQTGSYQFTVYNKELEVKKKKKQSIPDWLEGANLLRLEYKIVRRRGIQAKFNRDLTAYDLFHPTIYRNLQELFIEAYQAIPKLGRQYHIETLEKVTPKLWTELVAEQYRQNTMSEYMHLLRTLKESGALSDKNFERIRAADRQRERRFRMIDKSPLIAELDGYVMSIRKPLIVNPPMNDTGNDI